MLIAIEQGASCLDRIYSRCCSVGSEELSLASDMRFASREKGHSLAMVSAALVCPGGG